MPAACLLYVLGSWMMLGEKMPDSINDQVIVNRVTTYIKTYKSASLGDKPTLVITLHGDAPFNKPGYQYAFARAVADTGQNVVAVGMLRPGYTDPMARTSDGVRGDAVGDNYDAARIDQIASAIRSLESHYRPGKVILVGHSGGSALTALLTAQHPQLVDHAFLISCPCNVNLWRQDMFKLTHQPVFKGGIKVVSPHEVVEEIPAQTKFTLFVGDKDPVTQPYLSQAFAKALSDSGKTVTLEIIPGDHELLLHANVIAAVAAETY